MTRLTISQVGNKKRSGLERRSWGATNWVAGVESRQAQALLERRRGRKLLEGWATSDGPRAEAHTVRGRAKSGSLELGTAGPSASTRESE